MCYCSREWVTIITASGLSFTTKLDENSLLFGSFIPFGTDQMSLFAPEFVSGMHSPSL